MRYYSDLTLSEHWREALFLLRANLQDLRSESFEPVFLEVEEYRQLVKRYCGLNLESAKVFEIGYGRRPDRLTILMSQGVDASGVDLYLPILALSPSDLFKAWRINRAGSTLRSAMRYLLFDIPRRRKLAQELAHRGYGLRIERRGFLVNNVATLDLGEQQFDLIFSEDVFEHIPEQDLEILLPKLRRWLKPNGICLIRPDIFTGVWGGHLCERLYLGNERPTVIEAWEHLRKDRFRSTVYVNRLTRRQYRDIFSRYFDLVEERVKDPEFGRDLLTPEIACELRQYPEDELLSNRVLFVLRPKWTTSARDAR